MLLAAGCGNRKTRTMTKVLITLIMAATLLLAGGCGSTPKKVAYKTLSAVGAATGAASDAIVDARLAGKITDAQWEQANNAYNDFLRVYSFACTTAAQDTFAPADVIRVEVEFLNIVNSILKSK